MTTVAAPITEAARAPSRAETSPAALRLHDLLDLEHAELAPLYARASVPRIDALHGDLRGRMLAIPALPARATALPRAWARTASFPWRGKSFWPVSEGRGEGKNRVIKDRWKLFRFTTFVGPSLDDGKDAVRLDYDHPDNPFFIRAIEDEIRELHEGLYLGQAWLRVRGRASFVLWFALEAR